MMLDSGAVALSLYVALLLRLPDSWPAATQSGAASGAALGVAISIFVFRAAGIYRQSWRYISLKELVLLGQACLLTVGLSACIAWLFLSEPQWLPGSVPVIQWFVLVVLLGSMRAGRRIAREMLNQVRGRRGSRDMVKVALADPPAGEEALLIGDMDWAESLLRMLKQGRGAGCTPIGILTHDGGSENISIRGVPVLGTVDRLEMIVGELRRAQRSPSFVIVDQADRRLTGPRTAKLATRAAQLGLELARAQELGKLHHKGQGSLDLEFLNLTDLLGRPELRLDARLVSHAVSGRKIVVTGAGGTIGSELVRQIAGLGASEIILLDHAECALYTIDMELRESFPNVRSTPLLCSIRQREAVMQAFQHHRPDLVFHAAALKHVPLVETNLAAGVLTNVIGTRNVADAVLSCGARAMIQVSTDKAVNPVGMMGATKRVGELYCQALDLSAPADPTDCRFLTVRFGNVLGSSGSLIPLFLRQLSRRGPLTVTHPDIERFFMTVHEAVQLILHSAAGTLRGGVDRGRIFVLDMGDPIKIVEIARRLIRAAGLVPDIDVKIEYVGLRPGEKLFEELFDSGEERLPSSLPGIFEAEPQPVPLPVLCAVLDELELRARNGEVARLRAIMRSIVGMHEDEAAAASVTTLSGSRVIDQPTLVEASR